MRFAIDAGYPEFERDRVFDPQVHARYPGTETWSLVKRFLERAGGEVHTADLYLGDDVRDVRLIAHGLSHPSRHLLERGAAGQVLVSWESPNVAWEYYHVLPRLSPRYRHVFAFTGALRRIRGAAAHPIFAPQPRREAIDDDWSGRRLVAVVNSNIRPEPVGAGPLLRAMFSRLRPRAERRSIRRQVVGLIDPELGVDLYGSRWRLIEKLSRLADLDLYGRFWDEVGPQRIAAPRHVLSRWRGAVPDKIAVLRQYKFALCVENTRFPGYITEKIFDILAAGAIPLYLGAPDVAAHIPEDAFYDIARLGRAETLVELMRGMGPVEAERMRAAARAFLGSSRFEAFAADAIAREIAEACLAA